METRESLANLLESLAQGLRDNKPLDLISLYLDEATEIAEQLINKEEVA